MSSDLSAEITAIATAALALFAILTAAFAYLAYRLPHTPASLRLYAPDATTAYQRALAAGATPATEVTALRDQPA